MLIRLLLIKYLFSSVQIANQNWINHIMYTIHMYPSNLFVTKCNGINRMSQLMRFWDIYHRRPAKAQAILRIRTVSPEPSLFAHMTYGSRRRVRPKLRHLAPLDGCTCAFTEDEKSHNLMSWIVYRTQETSALMIQLSRRNEPCHEKTCLRGLRPGKTQIGLLSYRDQLESWKFVFIKYRYYTI